MWIEIFKTGTHSDASGSTNTYSEADLEKIAEVYNSRISDEPGREAPIVKGHPKTDDPAFGWVQQLKRRGNILLAKLKELSPDFVDEVRKGLFKKVSIAIYPDMMLRHVGFLGAMPPAVKGLKPACFAEDLSFSEYEIDNSFSEISELYCHLNDAQEKNSQLAAQNSEYKERINRLERDARSKEFREFTDEIIKKNNTFFLTPAQTDTLIEMLELAHNHDTIFLSGKEFSEDESMLSRLKGLFRGFGKSFLTKEFALKSNCSSGFTTEIDFSNRNVSDEKLKLHQKAKELQQETPSLNYEEAVVLAQKSLFN